MKTTTLFTLLALALTTTSLTLPIHNAASLALRSYTVPSTPNIHPRNEDDNNQSEVQDQESSRDSSGGLSLVPITSNPNEKYASTLLPFRLQSTNLDACPSLASILATLGASNLITLALSFAALGFSKPMNLLTFGRFSKKRPSDTLFMFLWVPLVLIILAGYSAAAGLSKSAEGWHPFNLVEYAIFLFTLPRTAWFAPFYLARKNTAYTYSLHTTLIAEFICASIGLYSMVSILRQVSFNDRGLLPDGVTPKLLPSRLDQQQTMVRIMLVGVAMFLLSYIGMVLVYLGTIFSKRARAMRRWGTYQAVVMGGVWAGSWVFWGAFVEVMAKEYCPASVYVQGLVVMIFGVLGSVVGGMAA
ncbi:hypothetical protein BJ508DRAFT_375760 [Ascobolus immersus RN42]|uniref:Uncharacterized protein n=1 Tax=Ascobolus immersus RN42 TaxID=1160509 RepID=A0A3N4I8Y0_ASCIM|nr:hypothetical protein BJ508DRAFT_375760 [Ascobolus immersus RN42]